MLSHCNIGLLVGRGSFGFLLILGQSCLGGIDVAIVDVGRILRVVLRSTSDAFGFLMDLKGFPIELVNLVFNQLLQHLGDGRLDDGKKQRLEDVEQELVLGLLELNVQALHVNVDSVDLEEVLPVGLVGCLHRNLEAETGATHVNVHDTSVFDRWETLFLMDVVADVLQVHLDARDRHHDLVLVLVGDGLTTPAEVVIAAEFERIGCEVVALDNKVFNDGIDHRVAVLNTWYGNVANALENTRDDDLAKILDQMRLEDGLTVLVVAELGEEFLHGSSELLVHWILVELESEELDLIEHTVGVIAIALAQEEMTVVVELVPFLSGIVLHDEALFFQAFTDVAIDGFEPILKFRVFVGITVDGIDSIHHVVSRSVVGKALEESLDLCQQRAVLIHKA